MERYSLVNLVIYWAMQRESDFKDIRDVLNVIDDDDMDEDLKKPCILDILFRSGLHPSVPRIKHGIAMDNELLKELQGYVPIEFFDFKMINSEVRRTPVILN